MKSTQLDGTDFGLGEYLNPHLPEGWRVQRLPSVYVTESEPRIEQYPGPRPRDTLTCAPRSSRQANVSRYELHIYGVPVTNCDDPLTAKIIAPERHHENIRCAVVLAHRDYKAAEKKRVDEFRSAEVRKAAEESAKMRELGLRLDREFGE